MILTLGVDEDVAGDGGEAEGIEVVDGVSVLRWRNSAALR